ncbi:sterol desaturase family protein [uncultured Sphingomonas sp.]|uniref:sterol desaturase family protein n=1 Tax=uncultured Sphingomonas sp. TaxID=158754 RepID=UPI00260E5D8A|nr:sterol desaturase family protein [uncultured Sphingomonas sp.]
MQENISDFVALVASSMGRQLGGTFLSPGSSLSIAALLLSLLVFVLVAVPRGHRRRVPLKVMARIVVPRRQFGTASGRADAGYFLGGVLLAGLAVGWAIVSADRVRAALLALAGGPGTAWLPWWAAATIATVVMFVAYEFAYWLDHWLKHRIAFFWHFHKVHHQAESLSLLTNGRVHPVDTIVFLNIVAVTLGTTQAGLMLALGAPATPIALHGSNALLMIASIAIAHLQHSHLWIGFGPRWGRWLLGPAHHQIHHSRAPEHYNRNLGNVLAVFDRLAGTFTAPHATHRPIRFGVDDGERAPHGPRALLIQPFIAAGAQFVAPLLRRTGRRRRSAGAANG